MTAQVKQRTCAVLSCRRRADLIPTKTLVPGLLVEIDLCQQHYEVWEVAFHAIFREKFGVDFVDPERN